MPRSSVHLLLALASLAFAPAALAQWRWTSLAALPRAGATLWPMFDPTRGCVVAFMPLGQIPSGDEAVAFEWNGRWQRHQSANGSGLQAVTGAVFDGTRGEAVVIGSPTISTSGPRFHVGYRAGRFRTVGSNPPTAPNAAFVHDAARGEVLAFGGTSGTFTVVDTMWRWNGTAWSTVAQPSLRPPARQHAALVFDPLRAKVVLFGGGDGVNNPFGDTWTWDGQVWQLIATTGPAPRQDAGFAFDAPSGACLLHGGNVRNVEVPGTWLWNGTTWTQVTVPASPGAGWLVETAARPLLLREGQPDGNGTYVWNGAGFTPVAPPQNALPKFETDLVYDAARDELVLFGGQPVATGLWLWHGGWRHVGVSANGPAGRRQHSMVYDAARQQVVLFGGRASDVGGVPLGDTWTWDGTSWTQHASAPPARFEAGLAFDAARGRCVLFGGTAVTQFGDTWLWDGVAWTQAQPATSPPPRWNPGMAYDEPRQRVVLLNGMVGGSGIQDLWEWNGTNWQQRQPLVQVAGTIAYHRQLGRVIVVTGFGAMHAWDGAQWQPLPASTPPGDRPQPMSMTWHDGLGQLLLYAFGPSDRTLWALTATAPLATTTGTPCAAGTNNDCDLLALGLPQLGNEHLQLDLRGRAGNTYGIVVFGVAPAAVPIGGGCTLLVDPSWSQLEWLNGAGCTSLLVPVPDVAALLGAVVLAQGGVLDGTGPVGGLSVSAALQLQLGR